MGRTVKASLDDESNGAGGVWVEFCLQSVDREHPNLQRPPVRGGSDLLVISLRRVPLPRRGVGFRAGVPALHPTRLFRLPSRPRRGEIIDPAALPLICERGRDVRDHRDSNG